MACRHVTRVYKKTATPARPPGSPVQCPDTSILMPTDADATAAAAADAVTDKLL